jgi:hypothetical protein
MDSGRCGSSLASGDALSFEAESLRRASMTSRARPLAPLPEPISDPVRLAYLTIHRRDHLGGVLREYEHAA